MTSEFSVNMNEYLPLRDVVFNTLRQAILKGELKPGERLMEIALAERLGVSRTPIREAMRKLEQEGLVTAEQGKGFYVNAQDSEMIKEQHLRKVEESLTAAIAAAEVAGISNDELKGMLEALLDVE